jgi:lipopolysaccharide transport system ATP-binding protein
MSRPIIEVSNVGKMYRLGEIGASSLRDEIGAFWSRLRGRDAEAGAREFWALRDVSFAIQPGEVVGIIGRNGAGKSTLLKVLSRITEPTVGRAVLRGRAASLLEVGTGFHPDLSGRDNIYLNGAILGMTRAEIRGKFDEIVAFAEVEKFIDTPVKRYSSGMYVRLAFAVAAHLEPEILIVDEVLAVGDAQFQRKCIGKMKDVAHLGRTVLFVSHNIAAITTLCSRAILFARGALIDDGTPEQVVPRYVREGAAVGHASWPGADAPGDDIIRLRDAGITDVDGKPIQAAGMESPFEVQIEYEILRPALNLHLGFRLSTADATAVFTSGDHDHLSDGLASRAPGRYLARCRIPGGLLSPQAYLLSFGAHVPGLKVHYFVESAVEFTVERTQSRGATVDDHRQGVISPVLPWRVERTSEATNRA